MALGGKCDRPIYEAEEGWRDCQCGTLHRHIVFLDPAPIPTPPPHHLIVRAADLPSDPTLCLCLSIAASAGKQQHQGRLQSPRQ